MKQGDFTQLAAEYVNRAGYSLTLLNYISAYIGAKKPGFMVADVGAGTGKLTENLIALGFRGYAVEPNDAMRSEGLRIVGSDRFTWMAGSGEATTLPDNSVDWVLMASSFHWTRPEQALPEFHRVLKPNGHLTVLWNPRDLERSELHQRIERRIHEMVPDLKRVSSGSKAYTQGIEGILLEGGLFQDIVHLDAPHSEVMTKDRYLGAWRSVNDIQAQAGPGLFQDILAMIENEIDGLDQIAVPYRTRAWTVRTTKT